MKEAHYQNIRYFVKRNRFVYWLLFPVVFLRKLVINWQRVLFRHLFNSVFDLVEDGSLVVRLSDFGGVFEIGFRSDILMSILRNQHFEPGLARIARTYVDPQKDVIDIGANIGLFTILFSDIISADSRVLAIEPSPAALAYLRRNISRNGCAKSVVVFEGAALSKRAVVQLNIIPGMEEYSSLNEIVHPVVKRKPHITLEVNGDTVDNFVDQFKLRPGFIKLDIEGAEYSALTGAIKTLIKYKPVILSELSDRLLTSHGDTSKKVIDLLRGHDYTVLDAAEPGLPIRYPFNGEILAIPFGDAHGQ